MVIAVFVGPVWADGRGRLELPSHDVPEAWLTKAERTEFRETPRYEDTVTYCRRLAEASPWIEYQGFGVSPEGRALPLLVASKDAAFTPETARASDKVVVLIQNAIHPGECAGKDASLMLLRDIAITKARAGLLDQVILLVIPIFNVDGHERFSPYSRINQNGPAEMGWRVTSRNLNLNRDYIKADAAEMRAWLSLWNAWCPDLFFDNHSTDGGDWQYDLMYAIDTTATAARPVVRWVEESLYPSLLPALKAEGHLPMVYFNLVDSRDPSKGIGSGGFGPRYSTGYGSIRNRPSILVETHALKSYRTRVIGHYNIMRLTLELVNRDSRSLRKAVRAADEELVKAGKTYDPQRRVAVALGRTDRTVPLTFKGYAYRREASDISGQDRIIYDHASPVDIETTWRREMEVTEAVAPPLAYIIPPQWTEVIEVARVHGLRCERLVEPITAEVESYRFSSVTFAKRPYEGRFSARFTAEPIVERRTCRAGSVLVPVDQPGARVAIHLLEPQAADSLVSWGFFNAIFEQKEYGEHYVLEAMAQRMLAEDPGLREVFEAKLQEDAEFAASPWARLYFFYRRSPYWDEKLNVYPVGRIVKPLEAQTEPVP
jgi:hypothetical protein